MSIGVWINIHVFSSILLVNVSDFMLIPRCFHYCSSVIELDVRDRDASGRHFIYRIVLDILGFCYHMKLIIVLSRSVKNCVGILTVITLNL